VYEVLQLVVQDMVETSDEGRNEGEGRRATSSSSELGQASGVDVLLEYRLYFVKAIVTFFTSLELLNSIELLYIINRSLSRSNAPSRSTTEHV
jgi:hypothetical protein